MGVGEKISACSYQRKNMVFLEQDSDATLFLEALQGAGVTPKFRHHHTDRRSKIRSYDQYRYQRPLIDRSEIERYTGQLKEATERHMSAMVDLDNQRDLLKSTMNALKLAESSNTVSRLRTLYSPVALTVTPAASGVMLSCSLSAKEVTEKQEIPVLAGFELHDAYTQDETSPVAALCKTYRHRLEPALKLFVTEHPV